MDTRIFYFTGSGNAFAIARAVAERLGDAEIFPMAKQMGGCDATAAERVGIVSPVYAWGPPRMVREFLGGLSVASDAYTFAITTCGGTPGRSAVLIDKWLRARGSRLSSGFNVRGDFLVELPGMGEMPIIRFAGWLGRNHIPEVATKRIDEIASVISQKRPRPVEKSNLSVNLFASPIYAGAMSAFKTADKAFSVTGRCVSCGTCARICPRENVRLVDGRPTWHQDCESCYACYLWCPQAAITYNGFPQPDPAHHPNVTLADMLLR